MGTACAWSMPQSGAGHAAASDRHHSLVLASLAIDAWPASAQRQADATRLLVTVVDPSGAVIPNAKVTVTGQEPATSKAEHRAGPDVAARAWRRSTRLAPGRYAIQAEFPRLRDRDGPRLPGAGGRQPPDDHAADQEGRRGRDGRPRQPDRRRSIRAATRSRPCSRASRSRRCPTIPTRWSGCSRRWRRRERRSASTDSPAASCRRSRRSDRSGCRAWTCSPRRTTAACSGMMFIDIMTQPGNGPLRGLGGLRVPRRRAERAESVHAGERRRGAEAGRRVARPAPSCRTSRRSRSPRSRRGCSTPATCWPPLPDAHDRAADPAARPSRTNVNGRFDQALTKDHLLRRSFQRNACDARQPGRRRLRPARSARTRRTRPTTSSGCRRTARSGAGSSASRGCRCAGRIRRARLG